MPRLSRPDSRDWTATLQYWLDRVSRVQTPPAPSAWHEEWTGYPDATWPTRNVRSRDSGELVLGPGVWCVSSLEMRSNTRLVLEAGAVLLRIPTVGAQQAVLHLAGRRNVTIEGEGAVDGNVAALPGGQAHCVAIEGGSRIRLRGIEIRGAPTSPLGGSYGDGLYVGSGAGGGPVTELLCEGLRFRDNERHAVFLVDCRRSVWRDCVLTDTTSSDPGSALNLEPNQTSETVGELLFDGCEFSHSELGLTAHNHYAGDWGAVTFRACRFVDCRQSGVSLAGGGLHQAMTFDGCEFSRNGTSGLYAYQARGLRLSGCQADSNVSSGMALQECDEFAISDIRAVRNGTSGIFLHSMAGPFRGRLDGCHVERNGQGGPGYSSYGVYVYGVSGPQLEVSGLRAGRAPQLGALNVEGCQLAEISVTGSVALT